LFGGEQSEIIINLDDNKNLGFDYAPPTKNITNRSYGYYETSPVTLDFCQQIGDFIKANQGAFLCCDYGYNTPLDTVTFRGFLDHKVTDGLQKPFSEDLTADVNFVEIMDFFYDNNHCVYNLMTQADFLGALYIDKRLHQLLRNINDNDIRQQLILGVQKLLLPNEMGQRFKFLLVTDSKQECYPFLDFYKPTRPKRLDAYT
jgi:SAM-dependent MidA family methyltransferase